jgi:hypothetical protein
MTFSEALSILDQASSVAHMSRIDHQKVVEALNYLKSYYESVEKEVSVEKA